jgi:hypothetical protein
MYILKEIIYLEYLKILIQKIILYYLSMDLIVINVVKNLQVIILIMLNGVNHVK